MSFESQKISFSNGQVFQFGDISLTRVQKKCCHVTHNINDVARITFKHLKEVEGEKGEKQPLNTINHCHLADDQLIASFHEIDRLGEKEIIELTSTIWRTMEEVDKCDELLHGDLKHSEFLLQNMSPQLLEGEQRDLDRAIATCQNRMYLLNEKFKDTKEVELKRNKGRLRTAEDGEKAVEKLIDELKILMEPHADQMRDVLMQATFLKKRIYAIDCIKEVITLAEQEIETHARIIKYAKSALTSLQRSLVSLSGKSTELPLNPQPVAKPLQAAPVVIAEDYLNEAEEEQYLYLLSTEHEDVVVEEMFPVEENVFKVQFAEDLQQVKDSIPPKDKEEEI